MNEPRISIGTRCVYSSGGIVSGAVLVGPQYFILLYYSQVLGLSASLVGFAMAVALFFDAVSDPTVGFVSDNWKSRWGRRHPFLYGSILPILGFHLLLWLPPAGLGETALFLYLLVGIVGLRLAITLFDVPANALVPELTSDYEDRTKLFAYKHMSYWMVGSIMGVAMYGIWLQPTAEYPDGIQNPEGYREAARAFAMLALAALLTFSLGLHRFIPQLKSSSRGALGPREFVRQGLDALRMPSLRTMILAGLVGRTGVGLTLALFAYIYSYFWEMNSSQMSLIYVSMTLGALPALVVLPRLAAGREKRTLAVGTRIVLTAFGVAPVFLRLLGLLPGNESDVIFWMLIVHIAVVSTLNVMAEGFENSMFADLVEQSELETARRPEGMILSSVTFIQKAGGAMGAWLSGIALDLVAFPRGAEIGEVPEASLFRLGLFYAPALLLLGCISAGLIARYRVERADHHQAVASLDSDTAARSNLPD